MLPVEKWPLRVFINVSYTIKQKVRLNHKYYFKNISNVISQCYGTSPYVELCICQASTPQIDYSACRL